MKKCLLLIAAIIAIASLYAQDDIVIHASNKINREATPQQVIDSLKKRFPNAKAVQYYRTKAAGIKAGWTVTEEDNLDPAYDVDYYTLSFKRDDFQYYGLFRADGSLVKSKFQQSDKPLPDAVKKALRQLAGDDYKDYTLLSKTYYKEVDHEKRKEYYQITAARKSDKKDIKTVVVDAEGKIIKH